MWPVRKSANGSFIPGGIEMSRISERVAAKFLQSQDGLARTPEELLRAVGEAQGTLHRATRMAIVPEDATPEERKRLSGILRAVKAMYEQTETVRLDLDEWIIDYKEARKAKL